MKMLTKPTLWDFMANISDSSMKRIKFRFFFIQTQTWKKTNLLSQGRMNFPLTTILKSVANLQIWGKYMRTF